MNARSQLQCGRFCLDLAQPRIMAIINVTPDSFSGDGHGKHLDQALRAVDRALAEGADLLDIGGESTRPGAPAVGEAEEIERVLPLLEALADAPVPISVDTFKPAVMRAALAAGASLINDIKACREDGAIEALAGSNAAVCLMHMQGQPRTMQTAPHYADVVAEVDDFLHQRARALLAAGIAPERIVLDPGFGFGKSVAHNFTLLAALAQLQKQGFAVLAGLSRKSMFAALSAEAAPAERLGASIAGALIAVQNGARIVRVHDVAPTRQALAVWQATLEQQPSILAVHS